MTSEVSREPRGEEQTEALTSISISISLFLFLLLAAAHRYARTFVLACLPACLLGGSSVCVEWFGVAMTTSYSTREKPSMSV